MMGTENNCGHCFWVHPRPSQWHVLQQGAPPSLPLLADMPTRNGDATHPERRWHSDAHGTATACIRNDDRARARNDDSTHRNDDSTQNDDGTHGTTTARTERRRHAQNDDGTHGTTTTRTERRHVRNDDSTHATTTARTQRRRHTRNNHGTHATTTARTQQRRHARNDDGTHRTTAAFTQVSAACAPGNKTPPATAVSVHRKLNTRAHLSVLLPEINPPCLFRSSFSVWPCRRCM